MRRQPKMERICSILEFHTKILYLDDWDISVRWATEEDQKACVEITFAKKGFWGAVHNIDYFTRTAEIIINRKIKIDKEEEVLVHELFHIIVGSATLAEEREEHLVEGLTEMYIEHLCRDE